MGARYKKVAAAWRHTCIICAGLDFRMQSVGDTSLQHTAQLEKQCVVQRARPQTMTCISIQCQAVKLHKNACYQRISGGECVFRRTWKESVDCGGEIAAGNVGCAAAHLLMHVRPIRLSSTNFSGCEAWRKRTHIQNAYPATWHACTNLHMTPGARGHAVTLTHSPPPI